MLRLRRYVMLAVVPAWVWFAVAAVTVLVVLGLLVVLVTGTGALAVTSDFAYQCDSAVGPDPQHTEQTRVTPSRTAPTSIPSSSALPTANPYAELTFAPDDTEVSDWQRSCISAMREAPYQGPEVTMRNSGPGARCAQELALAEASLPSATVSAEFVRTVIYRASYAAVSGRCLGTRSEGPPVAALGADNQEGTARGVCRSESKIVILPKTVAEQGLCGQRVDESAVSAGDLVFWDYRAHRPTRVGVAMDGALMVTTSQETGLTVRQAIPTSGDVRIKRVLDAA